MEICLQQNQLFGRVLNGVLNGLTVEHAMLWNYQDYIILVIDSDKQGEVLNAKDNHQ